VPVYDPEFRWYGTAMSGFGIIFNKRRLSELKLPEPQTWADLAKPEFFNQLATADPRNSGSALQAYEIILQAYGWEKGFRVLTEFSGNVKTYTRAASDVPKLVSLAEAAAGPAIDFYAWAQIAADGSEKIGYVLPQKLTVFNPDAIAILKGAPHLELARAFVRFVLSEEGQRLWILPKGSADGPRYKDLDRIPVLPRVLEVYRARSLVPLELNQLQAGFPYDADKGAARRDALKDLLGTQFIDTHGELRRAWGALIQAGLPEMGVAELCRPPVTEAELTELSQKRWSDALFRNETITRWTNFALQKYQVLARTAPAAPAK
jgi:ABC-type Fe3+ transport system substrate-binding protein